MKGHGGEALIPNEAASAVREAPPTESYVPPSMLAASDVSSSLPLPDGPGTAPPEARRPQWWSPSGNVFTAVRKFFAKPAAPRA